MLRRSGAAVKMVTLVGHPDDPAPGPGSDLTVAARRPAPSAAPLSRAVISVDARWLISIVLCACVAAEIGFVLLDYHVNYGRWTDIGALRRMTNIAREDGLASWFAATQTLFVGLTAWTIALVVRAQRLAWWRVGGWALVALLFTYMAVDDGAQLHERFGTAARLLGEGAAPVAWASFPSYTWQVTFGPIFALLGGVTALFLFATLPDRPSRRLVAAGFVCFTVAIGLDFLEGLERDHPWNVYTAITTRVDLDTWAAARFSQTGYAALDHFGRSAEEFLEMLGMTLFGVALLRALAASTPEIGIRWAPTGDVVR